MKKLFEMKGAQTTRQTSIEDAVRTKLEGTSDDREGALEEMRRQAFNCTCFLGALTELLHTKNIITDDEVERLLGWEFSFEEVEEEVPTKKRKKGRW